MNNLNIHNLEISFAAYPIPIIQFQAGKPLNYDVPGIFNRLKGSLEWNSIFLWQSWDLVISTNCRKNLLHFSNH